MTPVKEAASTSDKPLPNDIQSAIDVLCPPDRRAAWRRLIQYRNGLEDSKSLLETKHNDVSIKISAIKQRLIDGEIRKIKHVGNYYCTNCGQKNATIRIAQHGDIPKRISPFVKAIFRKKKRISKDNWAKIKAETCKPVDEMLEKELGLPGPIYYQNDDSWYKEEFALEVDFSSNSELTNAITELNRIELDQKAVSESLKILYDEVYSIPAMIPYRYW